MKEHSCDLSINTYYQLLMISYSTVSFSFILHSYIILCEGNIYVLKSIYYRHVFEELFSKEFIFTMLLSAMFLLHCAVAWVSFYSFLSSVAAFVAMFCAAFAARLRRLST